jgi:hypothetical protein
MFHNKGHQNEVKPGILAQDLQVGIGNINFFRPTVDITHESAPLISIACCASAARPRGATAPEVSRRARRAAGGADRCEFCCDRSPSWPRRGGEGQLIGAPSCPISNFPDFSDWPRWASRTCPYLSSSDAASKSAAAQVVRNGRRGGRHVGCASRRRDRGLWISRLCRQAIRSMPRRQLRAQLFEARFWTATFEMTWPFPDSRSSCGISGASPVWRAGAF